MLLSKLFSKKKSNHTLAVTFRQHSLALCYIAENGDVICRTMPLITGDYKSTVAQICAEKDIEQSNCHLVLSASQSQTVQIEKLSVPVAEINDALKWQVKDLVTYSPDNMILDYYDGAVAIAGQEKVNVVCTAKSDLKNIIAPLIDEDFDVKSIITEEFAFAALVPEQEAACLLICQQPNEEIVILIVKQGKLYFSRRLRGFMQIASKSEDELAMTVIDALSLEVQRSTDYFERQLKQAPIQSIQIIVPIEHEGFLARKLAENTNVAVEILSLPEGFQGKREYAAAIGAAQVLNAGKS